MRRRVRHRLQEWTNDIQALFSEGGVDEFVEPTEVFYVK
jgi:hypothetical protein